jgi:threonine/homoserine/homoserine lactone efflux protein
MFGTLDLPTFILAGLLLNITPGADTLYIFGRSTAHGLRAGIMAALGIGAGCIIHILAATIGLSAILAASSAAFTVVKMLGAAYLAYLGLTMLLGRVGQNDTAPGHGLRQFGRLQRAGTMMAAESVGKIPLSIIFWQGVLTNALNPKVALFFLAFLPQFIDAQAEAKWAGMLFLGLVFNGNGTLWNLLVAWSSARLSSRWNFATGGEAARWCNRVCGGLFLFFSIKLLQSER